MRRTALAILLALAATTNPALGDEAPPATSDPAHAVFTRRDAWLGAGALVVLLGAGWADRPLRDDVHLAGGAGGEWLSDVATPLGTPAVIAPGLLLCMASGRLLDRPGLTRAGARIAISVTASAVASETIKLSLGRERPDESPNDADHFRPLSGHDSFPSGHTTVAFAAAAAIDRETGTRWLKWVVYPAAGCVGWSRVHDDRHWASDVLGGAILGSWSAAKTEDLLMAHPGVLTRLHLGVRTSAAPLRLELTRRF